ncbi:MAG TPA: hypothetical protein VG944_16410 [Fimbriimonas sp.]|nr:hypothetical protein [Fimbriimonas sp.]
MTGKLCAIVALASAATFALGFSGDDAQGTTTRAFHSDVTVKNDGNLFVRETLSLTFG